MHGAIAEVLYLEGPHLGGLTGSRLGALYAIRSMGPILGSSLAKLPA